MTTAMATTTATRTTTMARLADARLSPAKALDILDAGCGTGLCGPLLAPYARRLVGVDLSDGMLKHAREKNGDRAWRR